MIMISLILSKDLMLLPALDSRNARLDRSRAGSYKALRQKNTETFQNAKRQGEDLIALS